MTPPDVATEAGRAWLRGLILREIGLCGPLAPGLVFGAVEAATPEDYAGEEPKHRAPFVVHELVEQGVLTLDTSGAYAFSTTAFYVLSIKWSEHDKGPSLTWFRPESKGYTFYLAAAGVFLEAEIAADEGYFSNGYTTLAIPAAEAWRVAEAQGLVPYKALAALRRKRRPSENTILTACADWNDKHPRGTYVLVDMPGEEPRLMRTAGYAFPHTGGATVFVIEPNKYQPDAHGDDKSVLLDRVTPTPTTRKKRSAA